MMSLAPSAEACRPVKKLWWRSTGFERKSAMTVRVNSSRSRSVGVSSQSTQLISLSWQ